MTTRSRASVDETIECKRSNKHRAGDSSSVPGDVGFVDVFALPASSTLSLGLERLDDPDVELSLDYMHQAAPAEQTRYRCSNCRKHLVEAHFSDRQRRSETTSTNEEGAPERKRHGVER